MRLPVQCRLSLLLLMLSPGQGLSMHLQLPSPIPPSHPHAPAATHTHTRIHPPIKTGHAAAHRFPGRGRRGPARAGLVRARARRVECVCVQPPGAHVASAVYASPLPSLPLQHSTHHPPTMNRRSLNSPPQGRDRGLHVPRQLRGGARPRRLCVRRGVCLGAAAAVTGGLIDRHAACSVCDVGGRRARGGCGGCGGGTLLQDCRGGLHASGGGGGRLAAQCQARARAPRTRVATPLLTLLRIDWSHAFKPSRTAHCKLHTVIISLPKHHKPPVPRIARTAANKNSAMQLSVLRKSGVRPVAAARRIVAVPRVVVVRARPVSFSGVWWENVSWQQGIRRSASPVF